MNFTTAPNPSLTTTGRLSTVTVGNIFELVPAAGGTSLGVNASIDNTANGPAASISIDAAKLRVPGFLDSTLERSMEGLKAVLLHSRAAPAGPTASR